MHNKKFVPCNNSLVEECVIKAAIQNPRYDSERSGPG